VEQWPFRREFGWRRSSERIFATNTALTSQVIEVGAREVVLAQGILGLLRSGAAIVAVEN
jgi:hypothetical protein